MKCPKCGSEHTKKPSVISRRWKLGTQICLDCDYQGDWLEFCPSLSVEERERIRKAAEPIVGPLRELLNPKPPN